MSKIKLSVVCITYNHEKFIRQTLDGFVMQRTEFPFEVLVHDDASTDKTADIIREYEQKYPDLFRCIYEKENQWEKKDICRDIVFPEVRGEYVALCEGDDYWTDPLKLQKQINFLETHSDYAVCFHPVAVVWEGKNCSEDVFPSEKLIEKLGKLDYSTLLKRNFIQTNSVVYRWRFGKDPLSLIPDNILPGDWFLHLLHAQTGKIGMLPEIMAVYRRHTGGIWQGAGKTLKWFYFVGMKCLNCFKMIEKTFGVSRQADIVYMSWGTFLAAVKMNDKNLQEKLLKEFPYLSYPRKNWVANYLVLLYLKTVSFILGKKHSIRFHAHYKALKRYLKW